MNQDNIMDSKDTGSKDLDAKTPQVDDAKREDDSSEEVQMKGPIGVPSLVTVHPVVLLSVVDHYSRVAKDVAKDAKKRVCGVLLGQTVGRKVEITNCYAGTYILSPLFTKPPSIMIR